VADLLGLGGFERDPEGAGQRRVNERPPRLNIRVPSIPPLRRSATSVVPPPMSTKIPPASTTSGMAQARAIA